MFTGIIQATVPIVDLQKEPGLYTFTLEFPQHLAKGLLDGASVALDGVCMTVVRSSNNQVVFQAMQETLNLTTLGTMEKGDVLNIERSMRIGEEIGGHQISGHVHGTATITDIKKPENNHVVTFQLDHSFMKYVFPKGFISINGTSLTVVDVNREHNTFTVWFIPETLKKTTFGTKKIGDVVNIEADQQTVTIVETMQTILKDSSAFSP